MVEEVKSNLTPMQRYGAGALFGLALNQAQIHQTQPLGWNAEDDEDSRSGERTSSGSSSDSVADDPRLWVNETSGLLRPVFRCLEIDSAAWSGLEETAGSSPAKHYIGAFLRLLSEEASGDASSKMLDQEAALADAVDAMARRIETSVSSEVKKDKQREFENECREKYSVPEAQSNAAVVDKESGTLPEAENNTSAVIKDDVHEARRTETSVSSELKKDKQREYEKECREKCSVPEAQSDAAVVEKESGTLPEAENNTSAVIKDDVHEPQTVSDEKPIPEVTTLSYQRKISVLYELLSACLTDKCEDNKKNAKRRKGYDARYRVALRLLAAWFDIEWIKVEATETMVACSAMALAKADETNEETSTSSGSKWAKWKRGGIIGAAALTGGALLAITGGLAAPAIAAGLGALAPTLGTLVPVIGASGFAAAASAAGSVVGSVAVAASFGAAGAGLTGSKMARRTGGVDEFEFKAVGENHSQGRLAVEILISGFVFNEEDFVKPWEGLMDNLERYVLQWETKKLIAVSTAIQDWLTSNLALQLMKQGAMHTVLSTLLAALAWPAALLVATDFIDSKWTIAVDRSDKAGKLLAEVLLKGLQGNRPVTLVGYSLGARVIFKCLQTLAKTEQNAELVERVILLGAPISIKNENWEDVRKMVAGRFINVYASNDWTLGLAFRASLLSQGLAGIQPICIPGIENVDVTDMVEGHSSYLWKTPQILDRLELDTYYPVFRK